MPNQRADLEDRRVKREGENTLQKKKVKMMMKA